MKTKKTKPLVELSISQLKDIYKSLLEADTIIQAVSSGCSLVSVNESLNLLFKKLYAPKKRQKIKSK